MTQGQSSTFAQFSFEDASSDSAIAALQPEWLELFARSGTRNPFAHPAWIRMWLRHFAPSEDRRLVVAVRRAGELVAVAPFARRSYGAGPLRTSSLTLVGAGAARADRFSEMTEILSLPQDRRRTLRALLYHLALERPVEWDWLSVTLPPEHGWFEPEAVPEQWQRLGARPIHKAVLAFVVLPLPDRFEDIPLKRNMKEAIRRSRNRLAAGAVTPEVAFAGGDEAAHALDQMQELHRQRATLVGHRAHPDYFADPATASFVREAGGELAAAGNATVALLRLDGTPIAARLVLAANDGLFLSLSGSDPEHWRLGAATALTVACIRRGIEQGSRLLNLSAAPDSAKLRWSEQLELHNEFFLVAPTRRARAAFGIYWHARAGRALLGGGGGVPGDDGES